MSGMQQPVLEYHSPSTVVKMRASLVILAAVIAVAYAAGQYYVPRSYYVIDAEGHETAPVPLRRLRRSLPPGYQNSVSPDADRPSGGNANAVANAEASDGGTANAYAKAFAVGRGSPTPGPLMGFGGYQNSQPGVFLGASRPKTNVASRQGWVSGHSVTATTNVGVNGQSGVGYYEQEASVEN